MKILQTSLQGVYEIQLEPLNDERGFFARVWCEELFKTLGLETHMAQCNMSYNMNKGTTRGIHYQIGPHEEVKLVRCIKGSIYDVAVDLRPNSPTYQQWFGIELSEKNLSALYIPKGFGHGFQTLEDDTLVFYQVSTPYTPRAERGIVWDDPKLQIQWPIKEGLILSDKDKGWPNL